MQIIFLRHGPAGSRADWHGPDAERPLTDDGRGVVALVADVLARAGVAVDALLTSPLVRSRQTAEIAAAALGCADRLADDQRLAHDFDRKRLAAIVADHPGARTSCSWATNPTSAPPSRSSRARAWPSRRRASPAST